MTSKNIFRIFLVVAVGALVVFARMRGRDDTSDRAKAEAMALLAMVDGYADNEQFYQPRVELAHTFAFNKTFEMAGRRRAAKFDEARYLSEFFEKLISIAQNEGRQNIVKALIDLRDKQGIPRPQ